MWKWNSTNGDLTCPHTKSDKLIFWTIFKSSSLDFTFSFLELPVKSTSGGTTLGTFPAWVLGIACNSLEISIFCLIELHLYLLIEITSVTSLLRNQLLINIFTIQSTGCCCSQTVITKIAFYTSSLHHIFNSGS